MHFFLQYRDSFHVFHSMLGRGQHGQYYTYTYIWTAAFGCTEMYCMSQLRSLTSEDGACQSDVGVFHLGSVGRKRTIATTNKTCTKN